MAKMTMKAAMGGKKPGAKDPMAAKKGAKDTMAAAKKGKMPSFLMMAKKGK